MLWLTTFFLFLFCCAAPMTSRNAVGTQKTHEPNLLDCVPMASRVLGNSLSPAQTMLMARCIPLLTPSHDESVEFCGTFWPRTTTALACNDSTVESASQLRDLTFLEILDLSGTAVADLSPLTDLRSLRQLNIGNTQVTDLRALAQLNTLKVLRISGGKIRNATPLKRLHQLQTLDLSVNYGLENVDFLNRLTALQTLDLSDTGVVNVSVIADLDELASLNLAFTDIRDARPLAKLKNLEFLVLEGTGVDSPGCEQLEQRLPNCVIVNCSPSASW